MAKKPTVTKAIRMSMAAPVPENYRQDSVMLGKGESKVTITQILTYCATQDGVQASGKTEKEALKLLEKTLAERAKA